MLCKLTNEKNIILVGMPGAGKTTIGRMLADTLARRFVDLDEVIAETTGRSPEEWLRTEGETIFRTKEHAALRSLSGERGIVLACGGGVVTVTENCALLRQNSWIVWLERELCKLETSGRPLSEGGHLALLYAARAPLYAAIADYRTENSGTPEETVRHILKAWREQDA